LNVLNDLNPTDSIRLEQSEGLEPLEHLEPGSETA